MEVVRILKIGWLILFLLFLSACDINAQDGRDEILNILGVYITILIIVSTIVYFVCRGKSKKKKYIVWGITTIGGLAYLLASVLGLIFSFFTEYDSGWVAAKATMTFLLLFIPVGIVIFFKGVFYKKE